MSLVLPAMPYAWIYFVSFIVTGTFTFVNLFVALVINNLSDAKKERLEELQDPEARLTAHFKNCGYNLSEINKL